MKKITLVLLVLFSSYYAKAQDEIQTVRILYNVEYIQSPQKQFELQSRVYKSDYMKKTIIGTFLKTKPITSILEIDNGISLYRNSYEDLDDQNDGKPGINMSLPLGGRGVYYQDTNEEEYFQKAKNMAMQEELVLYKKKKWEILEEEKEILGYTCKKAVHINKYNYKTYVWFTEEIPFSNGPKMLFGLNGVILEIEKERRVFKAKKIEINPKDILITKPKAKFKTTAEEKEKMFRTIMSEN